METIPPLSPNFSSSFLAPGFLLLLPCQKKKKKSSLSVSDTQLYSKAFELSFASMSCCFSHAPGDIPKIVSVTAQHRWVLGVLWA